MLEQKDTYQVSYSTTLYFVLFYQVKVLKMLKISSNWHKKYDGLSNDGYFENP